MNKVILAALTLSVSMPFAAVAAEQMTKEELIQYAMDKKTCGDTLTVLDAYYKDSRTVTVKCGDATGSRFGELGVGGAAAVAAGIALTAVAIGGGGGSTPDTTQ